MKNRDRQKDDRNKYYGEEDFDEFSKKNVNGKRNNKKDKKDYKRKDREYDNWN